MAIPPVSPGGVTPPPAWPPPVGPTAPTSVTPAAGGPPPHAATPGSPGGPGGLPPASPAGPTPPFGGPGRSGRPPRAPKGGWGRFAAFCVACVAVIAAVAAAADVGPFKNSASSGDHSTPTTEVVPHGSDDAPEGGNSHLEPDHDTGESSSEERSEGDSHTEGSDGEHTSEGGTHGPSSRDDEDSRGADDVDGEAGRSSHDTSDEPVLCDPGNDWDVWNRAQYRLNRLQNKMMEYFSPPSAFSDAGEFADRYERFLIEYCADNRETEEFEEELQVFEEELREILETSRGFRELSERQQERDIEYMLDRSHTD